MFVSEEPLKKTTLLVVSCSFFYWKRNSRSKLHVGFKEKKTMVVHSPQEPQEDSRCFPCVSEAARVSETAERFLGFFEKRTAERQVTTERQPSRRRTLRTTAFCCSVVLLAFQEEEPQEERLFFHTKMTNSLEIRYGFTKFYKTYFLLFTTKFKNTPANQLNYENTKINSTFHFALFFLQKRIWTASSWTWKVQNN